MVKKVIIFIPMLIAVFIISCVQDIFYGTYINWDINLANYSSNNMLVYVHSNEIGWKDRLDSLNLVPVLIKANDTVILKIKFKYLEEDEVPTVYDEKIFECQIYFINDSLDTLKYAIDLFPFPKWENYELCDEYFVAEEGTDYECFSSFLDTVNIFNDTINSTAEYFGNVN